MYEVLCVCVFDLGSVFLCLGKCVYVICSCMGVCVSQVLHACPYVKQEQLDLHSAACNALVWQSTACYL